MWSKTGASSEEAATLNLKLGVSENGSRNDWIGVENKERREDGI